MAQENHTNYPENSLNRFIEFLDKNLENVGSNFAKEALKMQYGVSEKRNSRGTSTTEEEKMLEKEEVQFYKIPLPFYNYDA